MKIRIDRVRGVTTVKVSGLCVCMFSVDEVKYSTSCRLQYDLHMRNDIAYDSLSLSLPTSESVEHTANLPSTEMEHQGYMNN